MTSCYSCTGDCTSSVDHVSGTYTGLGADDSDYTYDSVREDGTQIKSPPPLSHAICNFWGVFEKLS